MAKKVLIVGATGLIGNAVLKEISKEKETDVIAISRRIPTELYGANFVSVNLLNMSNCKSKLSTINGITHVIYAALYEGQDLTKGWIDGQQIYTNKKMIKNLFQAIIDSNANSLKHITLMQGTKAYGGHVRPFSIPAKEDKDDARDIPNFYWEHEEYIKELQKSYSFNYTILRPQIVIGKAIGSAMNIISAIGVYASILKEEGKPLYYPGTTNSIIETVDVDLLARSIIWAGNSANAINETFNVANGDVACLRNLWPVVAESFGMEMGEDKPTLLSEFLPSKSDKWREIAYKYNLTTINMNRFVGQSFQFADRYLSKLKYPLIVSSVKIKQAGFTEVMDTEEMFKKWLKEFQDNRLLPF